MCKFFVEARLELAGGLIFLGPYGYNTTKEKRTTNFLVVRVSQEVFEWFF